MKYINYTAKDFVSDTFFQKWVLVPDAEANAFWENWLQEYPFKKLDVIEAREIIETLNFTSDVETNNDFIEVWNKIHINIEEEAASYTNKPQILPNERFKHFQKLAAVFVGFLIISLGVLLLKPDKSHTTTYTTAFGQVKTITLPDSSQVTLNANSALTFASDWNNEDEPRQVWLKGEAFFRVLKKRQVKTDYAKFKVYTKNLNVEVLGTKFNVNNRRNNTHVVLQSGKVKVGFYKPSTQPNIFMQPGEYVGYNADNNGIVRKVVDSKLYTSWINNQLAFHKTTLKDIALLLEDNYGYQIIFKDESLAQNKFTGTIPGNDLSLLFTALSKLYNLQITQNQKQIVIASNNLK